MFLPPPLHVPQTPSPHAPHPGTVQQNHSSLGISCPVFVLLVNKLVSNSPKAVPAGSLSRGGDVMVCLRHKPTELANSFYSVLVSVSVFMALSTVFHSINSPDNSPLRPVLFLHYWSFQLYISL